MHPEYLLEYLHNELLEWTDGETVLWSSLLTKLLKKLEKFPDQQQG
jgi:succinate dehydrogenase flavin-adding protein (antitoxin of CptAB toxin-antitoxin module)